MNDWVVVSSIFYFHLYLGKIPILTLNHQLDEDGALLLKIKDFPLPC